MRVQFISPNRVGLKWGDAGEDGNWNGDEGRIRSDLTHRVRRATPTKQLVFFIRSIRLTRVIAIPTCWGLGRHHRVGERREAAENGGARRSSFIGPSQQRLSAPFRRSPRPVSSPSDVAGAARSRGATRSRATRVQRGYGFRGFADWGVDRDATTTNSSLFWDPARRVQCATRNESAPRRPSSFRPRPRCSPTQIGAPHSPRAPTTDHEPRAPSACCGMAPPGY